jgi:hypothetical protein
VTSARVLTADYDLIRQDFPVTRPLSTTEIDEWLIRSSAFLSQDQIEVGAKRGVNTPIYSDSKDLRSSMRPPNYGRALVLEVEGGILDAKGAGGVTRAISQSSHRSGLMETAEALREFAYSKLIKKALQHSGSEFRAIDGYAVLDYGFQVRSSVDDTFQPAGALIRQSHFRQIHKSEQLDRKSARKIERTLREYGITTAYRKTTHLKNQEIIYDVLNVQGSDSERFLFDFGGYRITDRFENPAITLPDLFKKNFRPVLSEPQLPLLQPNQKFKGLFTEWGGPDEKERIWLKAREISTQFKNTGNLIRARKDIEALLKPLSLIPDEARTRADFSCLRKAVEQMLRRDEL